MQQNKNVIPLLKHFPISGLQTLHKQCLFISLFHRISLKTAPDKLVCLKVIWPVCQAFDIFNFCSFIYAYICSFFQVILKGIDQLIPFRNPD